MCQVEDERRKQLSKAAKHQLWVLKSKNGERANTVPELNRLLRVCVTDGKKMRVLQNQLRFRMELDGNNAPVEGRWLSGRCVGEWKELRGLVEKMIREENPAERNTARVPAVLPLQEHRNPTSNRQKITELHNKEAQKQLDELMAAVEDGTFRKYLPSKSR